jgi:hypothetical protein
MRILPLTDQPPWPYEASEVLKRPKRALGFEDIVKRVRRFRSDSVVLIGSRLLWLFWNNPTLVDPSTPGGVGNRITQTYAERIISLACAYGSAYNRPTVSEVEFRLLCWELSSGMGEGFFTEKMVDRLRERLGHVAKDSPLRRLSPDMAQWLLATALRAHAVAEQHLGRTWDGHSLPRAILLAREYRKLALHHGGFDFERRQRAVLLADLDELARAHWVLFAKAAEGATVDVHGPKGVERIREQGLLILGEAQGEEVEVREKLGLTTDSLRAVAKRLSMSQPGFSQLREALDATPPALRRYAPQTDWLNIFPMVDIGVGERSEQFIVPSPWRMALAFSERILHDYVTLLEREHWVGDKSAYALRGEAFANYLRATLADVPGMFDLDAFENELPQGKRPDFAWVGEEYGVLVEAKFSLKPNTSRNLADVSAIVETWERAAEPVAQAGEFLGRGLPCLKGKLPTPKRWVLIVAANEPFIEEGLGFKVVAKAGGLLSGTGLDGIAMFSPTDLESWVLDGTPDELGERVHRVYEMLDPTAIEPQLDVGKPSCNGQRMPLHLARVWEELFQDRSGPG